MLVWINIPTDVYFYKFIFIFCWLITHKLLCYIFFLVNRMECGCQLLHRKMNLEKGSHSRSAKKQNDKEIVTMIHLTSAWSHPWANTTLPCNKENLSSALCYACFTWNFSVGNMKIVASSEGRGRWKYTTWKWNHAPFPLKTQEAFHNLINEGQTKIWL